MTRDRHDIRTLIILAGGKGSRLQALFPDLPKCLVPVRGIPFLSYQVNHFRNAGISQFIFSLGHLHNQVISFVRTSFAGLSSEFVVEESPLGTGGAIAGCCAIVQSEDVLVTNGDSFFNMDPAVISAKHFQSGADCTLAIKQLEDTGRYGRVNLSPTGTITAFAEKQQPAPGFINAGVYALNIDRFLAVAPAAPFSFEQDYLEKQARSGNIATAAGDGYFIDIGVPADYERAQVELA